MFYDLILYDISKLIHLNDLNAKLLLNKEIEIHSITKIAHLISVIWALNQSSRDCSRVHESDLFVEANYYYNYNNIRIIYVYIYTIML